MRRRHALHPDVRKTRVVELWSEAEWLPAWCHRQIDIFAEMS